MLASALRRRWRRGLECSILPLPIAGARRAASPPCSGDMYERMRLRCSRRRRRQLPEWRRRLRWQGTHMLARACSVISVLVRRAWAWVWACAVFLLCERELEQEQAAHLQSTASQLVPCAAGTRLRTLLALCAVAGHATKGWHVILPGSGKLRCAGSCVTCIPLIIRRPVCCCCIRGLLHIQDIYAAVR